MEDIVRNPGKKGTDLENSVQKYFEEHSIKFFRDHRMCGYGKKWEVDFYLPKSKTILLCKSWGKNKLAKSMFLADVLRCLDLRQKHKTNSIILMQGLHLPLSYLKMCIKFNIYVLYSVNGLYILSEKGFSKKPHIKEINETYLKNLDIHWSKTYFRRNEVLKVIHSYPQTIESLLRKFNESSRHTIISDIEYLVNEGLIIKKNWGKWKKTHVYSKQFLENNSLDKYSKGMYKNDGNQ